MTFGADSGENDVFFVEVEAAGGNGRAQRRPFGGQALLVHRAAFGADEDEGAVAAAGMFGMAVFAAVVAGVAA